MVKHQYIVLVLLAASLGGCATMSADECATGNWIAVGFEDGARGYTSEQFSKHRQACAKHGVTADMQAYQQGRSQGLVEFCQPGRGFDFGSNGGQYKGVCSVELEPGFLDAYRVGQRLYTLRTNVTGADLQIQNKKRELVVIEDEIANYEALLISQQSTTDDRVRLLADLKQLSERTGEIEVEIEVLIADLARHEQNLRNYEQTVTAFGY